MNTYVISEADVYGMGNGSSWTPRYVPKSVITCTKEKVEEMVKSMESNYSSYRYDKVNKIY